MTKIEMLEAKLAGAQVTLDLARVAKEHAIAAHADAWKTFADISAELLEARLTAAASVEG